MLNAEREDTQPVLRLSGFIIPHLSFRIPTNRAGARHKARPRPRREYLNWLLPCPSGYFASFFSTIQTFR
jgi:hypothetical protein